MLVALGCLGYAQCKLIGCCNLKMLSSLISSLAPASISVQAGALLLSLMVSGTTHSIHLQVVQSGTGGPGQEIAGRSFPGKLLHLINRKLWEQHSAIYST